MHNYRIQLILLSLPELRPSHFKFILKRMKMHYHFIRSPLALLIYYFEAHKKHNSKHNLNFKLQK
jgi:hypothetical protein